MQQSLRSLLPAPPGAREKLMKRSILLLFVACIFALFLAGTAFSETTATASKTTSLWKVSNGANDVYLLGSIHILKAADYPLHILMERALDETAIVVFETDLDSAQAASVQHLILSNAMYPEGKTLKSELDEKMYGAAAKKLEEKGVDIVQLDSLKPWFVALTVTISELQQMGFDFELGVDTYLHKEAKVKNKKIGKLESASFQINLFISLSEKEDEQFLMQTLDQLDDIEEYMDIIVSSWKTGDVEKLNKTLNKSFADYPELYERFIGRRNRNWVPQIEAYLQGDTPCLFVVGVAHMCGDQGLLALLEKQGYTVELVKLP